MELGGDSKYFFVFTPIPQKIMQFDEHMFKWVDSTNYK